MIRGEDHCGIESICETAQITPVKNRRRFFNY